MRPEISSYVLGRGEDENLTKNATIYYGRWLFRKGRGEICHRLTHSPFILLLLRRNLRPLRFLEISRRRKEAGSTHTIWTQKMNSLVKIPLNEEKEKSDLGEK